MGDRIPKRTAYPGEGGGGGGGGGQKNLGGQLILGVGVGGTCPGGSIV